MTASRSAHDLPPMDTAAAEELWRAYTAAHPDAVAAAPEYTVECFGDSPGLADELLALVLSGRKRATADLAAEFRHRGDRLPRIGSHWIACDGDGAPRIVIRSTEFRIGPSTSVDAAFAFDEGEGDRTLETWTADHRAYWARVAEARGATWVESEDVIFERFAVVWPPAHADARPDAGAPGESIDAG